MKFGRLEGHACLGYPNDNIGPLQNMEISRLPHRSASMMIAKVKVGDTLAHDHGSSKPRSKSFSLQHLAGGVLVPTSKGGSHALSQSLLLNPPVDKRRAMMLRFGTIRHKVWTV